jgi:hypothetical protein
MSGTINTIQQHCRYRTDANAVDTAATWGAAIDSNFTIAAGVDFRLRFTVANTGGANVGNVAWGPRYSKNGGAYTAITTSSSNVIAVNAGASVDGASITSDQLTAGTGSRANGFYDETGGETTGLNSGIYKEMEFGLRLVAADVTSGDTFNFRIYTGAGAALNTYSVTINATVQAAAQSLTPSLFTDTETHYTPAITVGAVTLVPSLFTDSDTFYTHALVEDIHLGEYTITVRAYDGVAYGTKTVTVTVSGVGLFFNNPINAMYKGTVV